MTSITNPVELRRKGFEVLARELGYANALRFLLQYEGGAGDYTRERHQLLPHWTPEQIVQEAEKLKPDRS